MTAAKDDHHLFRTYFLLARHYEQSLTYDSAISYLIKALQIAEASGDIYKVYNAACHLGNTYLNLREWNVKIFNPLGMTMSSYTWQPRFESDYAIGHNTKGELYEKDKDNEARSGSTLETAIDDYTRFITGVLQNKIIKPSSTKEMFSLQIRLRSVKQMGPLRFKDTTANDNIQLGYGLGWVVLQSPHGTGAFKEGQGHGFQHYSIIFPQ